VLGHGMHVCDYLLACDMEMDPVLGSLHLVGGWLRDMRCIPISHFAARDWLRRPRWCCASLEEERDVPVEVAPRNVLRRQLERAQAMGFRPMGASELELFVLRETYESAQQKGFDQLQTFGWYIEDYHTLQGSKSEALIGAIRRHLDNSGIPVEFSKGEWGPGQQEINLRYAEFLEMADRHVIYKQAAKEIAIQQGLAVTFMAKMDERYAGSSMHVHSSLWSADGATPQFAGGTVEQLPELFRWWLGGLIQHARASTLMFAPYVNSYKRFRDGSFAPTAIAWSMTTAPRGFGCSATARARASNAAFRVPTPTRIWRLRPRSPQAWTASPTRSSRRPSSAATATSRPSCRAFPAHCPKRSRPSRNQRCSAPPGEPVVAHLTHFARTEQRSSMKP
jgi:glutamine synthetase